MRLRLSFYPVSILQISMYQAIIYADQQGDNYLQIDTKFVKKHQVVDDKYAPKCYSQTGDAPRKRKITIATRVTL